ncbi:MAG: MmgE/PrpD family protein [Chloroflexi bacterium]|nr:MmgE/PrpD family protein [Chloroflexota bacterium]
MNETKQLARHVAQVQYEDLPAEVVAKAKQLILDQLGCELACSTEPWSKIVYDYTVDNNGAKEESTVVTYGLRTRAEDAALVNGTFGHGFEIDDTDLVSKIHPGCVVIPVAMALGEKESINGRDFITAVVAGYDVASRVGAAARLAIKRGFHPTPVFAPFGAVAAAGKILKMDGDQVLNAFGIVASHSCGLMEYSETGGSVKRLHAGIAAHAGVRSAMLARRGLTGPTAPLEGNKGLCQAFSDSQSLNDITDGLGREFRILWTGLKPYCCCAGQHAALDAASLVTTKYKVAPGEIEEIVVGSGPLELKAVGAITEPQDITGMQFSGRYGIALRLLKGGNGFAHYTEENLRDPELRSFARKISFVPDEDVEKTTLSGARVTMKLRDGRAVSEKVAWATGSVHRPLSQEEIERKFTVLASMVLPPGRVRQIIEVVGEMENLDTIRSLMPLLVK